MKTFLSILILISTSISYGESKASISPEMATLVAKAYVQGLGPEVYDFIDGGWSELDTPTETKKSYYQFVILDASGDCGMRISVLKNGLINQKYSDRTWSNCL